MGTILTLDLKSARQRAKITGEEMARYMNVSEATVSNWETGKTEPTASQFIQYAFVCGIPIDQLSLPKKAN